MEWRILAGGLIGATGWWLGGRGIKPFKKGWRRFLAPALLGGLVCSVLPLWRTALGVALLMAANSMGYGESSPWWNRLTTCLCLGLALLPFGLAWYQAALVPMWFGGNYLLSRLSTRHSWGFTEVSTGCIQGALAGMAT